MQYGRDPTFLGTVQDVSGSTLRVALDEETLSGLTFIEGQGYRIGQIGAFVRIPLGYTDLFGIVSQVGAGAAPERVAENFPHGHRWMTIQLAGQARRGGVFERGIAQYPTIGDNVHIITENDLQRIYGRSNNPTFVKIGVLAAAPSIPALLDINRLVTRHSVVVGATGSGKSTTVAGLMNALSSADYPSSRILMIDVHGEYARALRDRASIFRIGANEKLGEKELYVPYWALNFDELMSVAAGGLDDPAMRVTFADKIAELKQRSFAAHPITGIEEHLITVDTPIPFSLRRLWWDFHTAMRATHFETGKPQSPDTWALELDDKGNPVQKGDLKRVIPPRFRAIKDEKGDPEKIRLSNSRLNAGRPTDILAGRLRDRRLAFLFSCGPWSCDDEAVPVKADLDTLLREWIGGDRPISILDLSGVPPTIQSDLVGALLRILFESLFWGRSMPEGGRSRPLLVVLEEAHSYLNSITKSASSFAVQRIAKEGRKYGLGLMIVSQRPSEIDQTILSQCGTLISLRLSNAADRSHITSSVTDSLEGLLSALPILRTGEAIVVGEAVNLPIRALITPPSKDRAPDSQDPVVVTAQADEEETGGVGGWNAPSPPADYGKLVEAWRRQSIRSTPAKDDEVQKETDIIMDWISVSSTNVKAVAYEASTETLAVEFVAGNVYRYFDVPQSIFDEFLNAGSKGSFFNSTIKNRFRYERD
ncbi:MAG TPA: DUF87 domain-containing protein [Rhizomicrobium sp.]|nr:DUF87 domain-containing protein [Rhizomicrobium sp.]